MTDSVQRVQRHKDPESRGSRRSAYAVGDKRSYEYVLKSGLAGGVAGCAAKSIIAPLDRVKILFQTSNPEFAQYAGRPFGLWRAAAQIYRQAGVLGLFQGHSATLLRIFPYAGIKFVVYEQIRAVLISRPEQETALRRTLSGSLSGVASVFFTYPLELVRVRLAYDTRHDRRARFGRACVQIYGEGGRGARNFYRGFAPTVLGMLPYAGVSFWTHDTVHDVFRSDALAPYAVATGELRSDRQVPLAAWAQLAAGGVAGMVAQTASYPLEVVRRRMQVAGVRGAASSASGGTAMAGEGIAGTVAAIWREHGVRGFYVGLTIGYIKVVPMAACSFFVYERMKAALGI